MKLKSIGTIIKTLEQNLTFLGRFFITKRAIIGKFILKKQTKLRFR